MGYFLVFEYSTGPYFTIYVFDITGCEIIYPFRVRKTSPQPHEGNQLYFLISDDEEELLDSDSVECLDNMLTDSDPDSPKQRSASNRDHVIDPDYVVYLEVACSFIPPLHPKESTNCMHHESRAVEGNGEQFLRTMKAMKAARRLKTLTSSLKCGNTMFLIW